MQWTKDAMSLFFFEDLQNAPSADFYRPVGRLGELFMELEEALLKERVNG